MLHVMIGTVISLEERGSGYTMALKQENGGDVLFMIDRTAALLDESGTSRDWASVAVGMRCAAVVSDDTPMTMSLPPQISGAHGFILVDSYNVAAGCFDETLTDWALCLHLQIGAETAVTNFRGNRLLPADLVGRESVVVYGRTTRSIPAQTTPISVVVFEEKTEYLR